MKNRKSVSLTTKLFLLIFCIFALILVSSFIGIALFFEPYFVKKQLGNIRDEINVSVKSDQVQLMNEVDMAKWVTDFTGSHDYPLAIIKDDKVYYPNRRHTVYLATSKGIVQVDLSDAIFQLNSRGTIIQKGIELSFVGVWSKGKFLGYSLYDLPEYKIKELTSTPGIRLEDITRVTGKVVDYDLPNYDVGSIYKQDIMYQIYRGMENNNLLPSSDGIYSEVDVKTGIKNYLLILQYNEMSVISLYSSQPVKQVINFLPKFLWYIILLAIVCMLVSTFIISRILVRPVKAINAVTHDMSNLDFRRRIKIISNDEVGDLSQNINQMADVLENTLMELESRNNELEKELELKKQYEIAQKQFIADASHELKTPLGIVQAYIERLEDKCLGDSDEKARKYTGIILDENRKMNSLINQLLELSVLESKAELLSQTKYNFSMQLYSIINRSEAMYSENSINLSCDIQADVIITGDKELLNQVVTNLMSNACKYSKPSSTVFIGLKKMDNRIYFYIRNKAINIESIDTKKIWQRFYKEDSSRSRKTGGIGLGLAIVSRILKRHGLKYGAAKNMDFLEFYIYFPID